SPLSLRSGPALPRSRAGKEPSSTTRTDIAAGWPRIQTARRSSSASKLASSLNTGMTMTTSDWNMMVFHHPSQIGLVGEPDAVLERGRGAPAEFCQPADIEQLARRAVRP